MAKSATAVATPNLRQNERVMAAEDLPRVPKGTMGTVTMVSGLTWIRYWVRFDNGERIGTLHRDRLVNEQDHNRRSDGGSSVAALDSGVAEAAAATSGAAESVGGVPGYLIERSKAARARWAAKVAG
jgi:hypothetical protein